MARGLAAALALPGYLYGASVAAMLAYLVAWLGPERVLAALFSGLAARAVMLSVVVASAVTLAALALGVPLGYALSRGLVPGSRVLEPLLLVPFGMPPVALGSLLLLTLAGPARPVEELLGLLYSPRGLVAAQFIVVYPMVVRALKAGFDAVPWSYEAVTRSLGYGWAHTMARVVLPMARRGLAAAAVLGFTRALGEFGASVMVAGVTRETMTLPIAIYSLIGGGDFAAGLALVLLSAASSAAAAAALSRLEAREGW